MLKACSRTMRFGKSHQMSDAQGKVLPPSLFKLSDSCRRLRMLKQMLICLQEEAAQGPSPIFPKTLPFPSFLNSFFRTPLCLSESSTCVLQVCVPESSRGHCAWVGGDAAGAPATLQAQSPHGQCNRELQQGMPEDCSIAPLDLGLRRTESSINRRGAAVGFCLLEEFF